MTAILSKLSVCPCGFPALDEKIQLGTEYQVEPCRQMPIIFVCGGCRKVQHIMAIWVITRTGAPREWGGGLLPLGLFSFETDVLTFAA